MVKLLENTFRMINIGLANEMAQMCWRMNIDVWEVIEAASTKPFGFMPFYPGPGLGGHCIPIDPHYLSWKTKQVGHEPRFIELAAQINGSMPRFVVDKIQGALNECSKPVRGSRIHIVGVAYKRDVSDIRESPALEIMEMLRVIGGVVSYTDPLVPSLDLGGVRFVSEDLDTFARQADCVVIIADHTALDYQHLAEVSQIIVDTRNRLKNIRTDRVVRL
jgi:UDP-N-acetyl-D-glucosamine dehydrogenase